MLGWLSPAAALASNVKRSRSAEPTETCSGRNLSATVRSSLASVALYTTSIPPPPPPFSREFFNGSWPGQPGGPRPPAPGRKRRGPQNGDRSLKKRSQAILGHAALSELFEDLIMRDCRVDHRGCLIFSSHD